MASPIFYFPFKQKKRVEADVTPAATALGVWAGAFGSGAASQAHGAVICHGARLDHAGARGQLSDEQKFLRPSLPCCERDASLLSLHPCRSAGGRGLFISKAV